MVCKSSCVLLTLDNPDLANSADRSARERCDTRHVSQHNRHERELLTGDRWERAAVTRAEFERWTTLSTTDPLDEIVRKALEARVFQVHLSVFTAFVSRCRGPAPGKLVSKGEREVSN